MTSLLDYFISTGAVRRGEFVGKSGEKYSVETDIRTCFTSVASALRAAGMLLDEIQKLNLPSGAFLGVPETGSLIAHYLNIVRHERTGVDFSVNMLRAQPKPYQSDTDSIVTVLPRTDSPFVLIEDDIVTGATMDKYLTTALDARLNIVAALTVFSRAADTQIERHCKKYEIPFYSLINIGG